MSDYDEYMAIKEDIILADTIFEALNIGKLIDSFPLPHPAYMVTLCQYVEDRREEMRVIAERHGMRITDDARIIFEYGSNNSTHCVIFDAHPTEVQQILGLEQNILHHSVGIDYEVARTIDSKLNGHFRDGRNVGGKLYLFTNDMRVADGYAEFYLKCKSEGITPDFDALDDLK